VLSHLRALAVFAAFILPGLSQAAEPEEEKTVKINFAALDLATVARQVERVTKRTFLFDENLLRNVKVTLQSDKAISATEFYKVFQTICQMNDLALVPVEGAGLALEKIVKTQAAFKEPGVHQVLVRGEPLPGEDHSVSYLVKLKNASAARVIAAITPSLSPAGSVQQISGTEMIVINDVPSTIKRIEKMLNLIDTPGEPVVSRTMVIRNISVDKAQSLLNEYLQALAKVGATEPARDKLALIKDERLNTLYFVGPEPDVKRAETFLASIDIDAPGARRTIRYYKLKNVPVKDIVDYVSQLLGLALAAKQQEQALEKPDSTPPAFTPAPPPPMAGVPPVPIPAPVTLVGPRLAPRAAGGGARDSAKIPADIIPVDGLNMLVVAAEEAVHKEVEGILKNLDRRKGQVLIEVAIVQVTGDDSRDLGIEALSTNNADNNQKQVDFGSGFGLGQQADSRPGVGSELRGFPTESLVTGFTGGAFRFVNQDNLNVVLRALSTKSNVAIVSQPILLVNDNETASFTTKVSEPTVTTSQGTATTNTSFSGFADATTALKITPHISPDGYLNLEITQSFEEFTGASTGSGIPPAKVSNNADTKVTIPDRQTIVIGGFTRDSSIDGKSGIPGLMQIPGVGKLFSRESKRKTLSRLYLFVRPKILVNPAFADLEAESDEKKDDVRKMTKKSAIKNEVREKIADIVPPDDVEVIEESEREK